MRYAQCALLVLFALLFYGSAAGAQSANQSNRGNITTEINSTASYIEQVNQSSYLIFYPNLTSAYKYLEMARNESQLNQDYALSLLAKARESAQTEQNLILRYQNISLYSLAALTVFLAIVLYVFMKPNKRGNRPEKRQKRT
jgi:hypothetical protein